MASAASVFLSNSLSLAASGASTLSSSDSLTNLILGLEEASSFLGEFSASLLSTSLVSISLDFSLTSLLAFSEFFSSLLGSGVFFSSTFSSFLTGVLCVSSLNGGGLTAGVTSTFLTLLSFGLSSFDSDEASSSFNLSGDLILSSDKLDSVSMASSTVVSSLTTEVFSATSCSALPSSPAGLISLSFSSVTTITISSPPTVTVSSPIFLKVTFKWSPPSPTTPFTNSKLLLSKLGCLETLLSTLHFPSKSTQTTSSLPGLSVNSVARLQDSLLGLVDPPVPAVHAPLP